MSLWLTRLGLLDVPGLLAPSRAERVAGGSRRVTVAPRAAPMSSRPDMSSDMGDMGVQPPRATQATPLRDDRAAPSSCKGASV